MANSPEQLQEISLLNIPLDRIKGKDSWGGDDEINLESFENRESDNNRAVKEKMIDLERKAEELRADLDYFENDPEWAERMVLIEEYPEEKAKALEQIENDKAELADLDAKIAELQSQMILRPKGSIKEMVQKSFIPTYIQTLKSRNFDPENARLYGDVVISQYNNPGRYTIDFRMSGLRGENSQGLISTTLFFDSTAKNIDSDSPRRVDSFIFGTNEKGERRLIGQYPDIKAAADQAGKTVLQYLEEVEGINEQNISEMWMKDPERYIG